MLSFSILLLLLFVNRSYAEQSQQEVYKKGKDFTKKLLPATVDIFDNNKSIKDRLGITPSVDASKYVDGNMKGAGLQKSFDKNSPAGQASRIVRFAKPVKIDRGAQWLLESKRKVQAQQKVLGTMMQKTSQGCQTVKGKALPREDITLTCDVYKTARQKVCETVRDIQVARHVTYTCDKEMTRNFRTCERTVTYSCGDNCPISTFSSSNDDVQVTYDASKGILKVKGRYAEGEEDGVVRRRISFTIPDNKVLGNIKSFTLIKYTMKYYLSIEKEICTGWHGDFHCSDPTIISLGGGDPTIHTFTDKKNVIPYLAEGRNTFLITTFSGYFEVTFKIEYRLQEQWQEVCN